MPPLTTRRIDERGVKLIESWIAAMAPGKPIVREWQMEDLLPAIDGTLAGRSILSGKSAFRDTGCGQCHRLGGEGGTVGPDLTGIARRQGARDILESILLPSKVIADEYAAFAVETEDGQVAVGRVEREDADVLVLQPASFDEAPLEIEKKRIRSRERLDVSSMPAGMVNVLEKEQVLDLIAYLLGDGVEARRVAALVTVYRHNSHADVIVSRLLETDTLDGKGKVSPLKLASLYTDQRPEGDMSGLLSTTHGFPIHDSVAGALTLGTGKLAVDGVLLVAEHGDYPASPTGSVQYPKRRLWDEMLEVFRSSGRVVPVFVDKHLADNWADAKHIYDSARELKIPLMAGSSVPGTWRHPAADVERGGRISEIVALTFHTTDAYGFHALEAVQALAEQRKGGETGIVAVRCLGGDAVWKAQEENLFDPELFAAAWARLPRRLNGDRTLREAVAKPKLMIVEYADGLRAFLLELNGAVGEWSATWRYKDDRRVESTQFWTQEGRPAAHFTLLLNGIERMMLTGKPSWSVERTLLTSGALDALLQSHAGGGTRIETPYLGVSYTPIWRWQAPPPPPPGRPWSER
jgi:putative heme-binding domain-containing protein